jgi:hypothetical protein
MQDGSSRDRTCRSRHTSLVAALYCRLRHIATCTCWSCAFCGSLLERQIRQGRSIPEPLQGSRPDRDPVRHTRFDLVLTGCAPSAPPGALSNGGSEAAKCDLRAAPASRAPADGAHRRRTSSDGTEARSGDVAALPPGSRCSVSSRPAGEGISRCASDLQSGSSLRGASFCASSNGPTGSHLVAMLENSFPISISDISPLTG